MAHWTLLRYTWWYVWYIPGIYHTYQSRYQLEEEFVSVIIPPTPLRFYVRVPAACELAPVFFLRTSLVYSSTRYRLYSRDRYSIIIARACAASRRQPGSPLDLWVPREKVNIYILESWLSCTRIMRHDVGLSWCCCPSSILLQKIPFYGSMAFIHLCSSGTYIPWCPRYSCDGTGKATRKMWEHNNTITHRSPWPSRVEFSDHIIRYHIILYEEIPNKCIIPRVSACYRHHVPLTVYQVCIAFGHITEWGLPQNGPLIYVPYLWYVHARLPGTSTRSRDIYMYEYVPVLC